MLDNLKDGLRTAIKKIVSSSGIDEGSGNRSEWYCSNIRNQQTQSRFKTGGVDLKKIV